MLKGKVIESRPLSIRVSWPLIDITSPSASASAEEFLAAIELLAGALQGMEGVLGYVGVTEYARAYFLHVGPHAHVAVLAEAENFDSIRTQLWAGWMALGGDDAWAEPRQEGLDGFISYVGKGPIVQKAGKWFEETELRFLDRNVLGPIEDEQGRPAVRRFIGGRALSGHGFRRLRARASFKARHGRVNRRSYHDPDRPHRRYLPSLAVCFEPRCPRCDGHGPRVIAKGSDQRGKKRFYCKSCERGWTDKAVFAQESARLLERRIERSILRLHDAGLSYARIARALGVGKDRVGAVIRATTCRENAPCTSDPRDGDQEQHTNPPQTRREPEVGA